MPKLDYPDLSKPADQPGLPERKDALVPDPQEFDFTDPDRAGEVNETNTASLSAKDRLGLFEQLTYVSPVEKIA